MVQYPALIFALCAAATTAAKAAPLDSFALASAGAFWANADLGPVLQVADADACAAACLAIGPACIAFNACLNGSAVRCGPLAYDRALALDPNAGCNAFARLQPRNDSRVQQAVPWRLAAPANNAVRLPVGAAGGPLRAMFDANAAYLLQYEVDEMLFPFRARAGLPQPPGAACFGCK
jgi:hypothetical protein